MDKEPRKTASGLPGIQSQWHTGVWQVAAGPRVHLLLRGGKLGTFSLKQHCVEINGVKKGEGRAECRAAAQPPERWGCAAPRAACVSRRLTSQIWFQAQPWAGKGLTGTLHVNCICGDYGMFIQCSDFLSECLDFLKSLLSAQVLSTEQTFFSLSLPPTPPPSFFF